MKEIHRILIERSLVQLQSASQEAVAQMDRALKSFFQLVPHRLIAKTVVYERDSSNAWIFV